MKRTYLVNSDVINNNQQEQTKKETKTSNPFNRKTKVIENKNDNSDSSINSEKSMKKKINKFYRPLIKKFHINSKNKQYKIQKDNDDFNKYPHIYDTTYCEDNGNSTMRYVIPSITKVIQQYKFMNETKIPISFYTRPLSNPASNESEIPIIDKIDNEIFRCERCKGFLNPNFVFTNNFRNYTCNLCFNVGKIDPKYDINDSLVEINKGSYEFLVDNSKYQINKNSFNSNTICLMIETSNLMIENGIFERVLISIEYLLESLPQNINLIFMTVDNSIKYYKYNGENNIETWISLDESCSPYSINEVSLNIENDKTKILETLNFIKNEKNEDYENNFEIRKKIEINYLNAFKSIRDLFNYQGGRTILFLSNTNSIFDSKEIKNNNEDQNKPIFNNYLNSGNETIRKYIEIGEKLKNENIICECFYFSLKNNYNLIPITQIIKRTSGEVNIFKNYKEEIECERLYYDILQTLTKNVGVDVAFRVRFNPCFNILNYFTPNGIKQELDFSVNGLNSDQNIVCNFTQIDNPKSEFVYFQFVTLYTNIWNQRLIRIHNLKLPVESNQILIYKNINLEILTFSLLREFLYQVTKLSIKELEDKLYDKLKKIMAHYRYESGNTYDTKEFAMPTSLKYFPLYIYIILCNPIFNSTLGLNQIDIYEKLIELSNYDLKKLLFSLYPKIFKINLNILEKEYGTIDEETGYTILPPSIPCTEKIIKNNNIYIIDNNKNILIYVKLGVEQELLYEAFGIETFDELYSLQEFPQIETELNQRMHNIINKINQDNINNIQNILLIPEQSVLDNKFIPPIYTETMNSKNGENYWSFLNILHKNIKQDY